MLSIFGCSLDKSDLAGSLALKWCTKFTLLGLYFDQCLEEMDENFEKAVGKRQKLAKKWRYRYLTVFGKICVIKTLILPKLAHLATSLPNISRKKIEEIGKICLKFLKLTRDPLLILLGLYMLTGLKLV